MKLIALAAAALVAGTVAAPVQAEVVHKKVVVVKRTTVVHRTVHRPARHCRYVWANHHRVRRCY